MADFVPSGYIIGMLENLCEQDTHAGILIKINFYLGLFKEINKRDEKIHFLESEIKKLREK